MLFDLSLLSSNFLLLLQYILSMKLKFGTVIVTIQFSDSPTYCAQTNFRRRSYQYIEILMINVATQFPNLISNNKEIRRLMVIFDTVGY